MGELVDWQRVAERLKALAARGDQKMLASKLGVDDSTVSNWLSGKREPSIETMLELMSLLGADPGLILQADPVAAVAADFGISTEDAAKILETREAVRAGTLRPEDVKVSVESDGALGDVVDSGNLSARISRFVLGDKRPANAPVSISVPDGASVVHFDGTRRHKGAPPAEEATRLQRIEEQGERQLRILEEILAELRARSKPVAFGPRRVPPRENGANVDEQRELHSTELPVMLYAAAGAGKDAQPVPTGETVMVVNPQAREAKRGGWTVVKVLGESMEPYYPDGTLVFIKPNAPHETVKDGDVALVLHNGEQMLKVLSFERKGRRMVGVVLKSLNPEHADIEVGEDENFRLIGPMMGHAGGPRNYRSLLPKKGDRSGH